MSEKENWTKESALQHLTDNYNKLNSPVAFAGSKAIWNFYNGALSYSDIYNFLHSTDSFTSFRETKTPKTWNPVFCRRPREIIEADLVILDKDLAKENDDTKNLAVFVDAFTKKAWILPMKNKTAATMKKTFLKAFKEIRKGGKIQTFSCDKGSEFKNAIFLEMLKKKNIQMKHHKSLGKSPNVERLNRTFETILSRYLRENNTKKFLHVLPRLQALYNSRFHSSIQTTPNTAEKPFYWPKILAINELKYSKIRKSKPKFRLNDLVRIFREKSKFLRIYKSQMTDEIFQICEIFDNFRKPLYGIKDLKGERVDGRWHQWELTLVHYHSLFTVRDYKKVSKGVAECTFVGLPDDITLQVKHTSSLKQSRHKPLLQFASVSNNG